MRVESYMLTEHDWIPNNQRLPVLVYRAALADEEGGPSAMEFEQLFGRHGWVARWRDAILDYYHYHSTAHEALGVAAGSATVTLGGPGGREIELGAGDALALPAGTGHCCRVASEDFLVVGAYPDGQDWDICREAPNNAARKRMRALPVPRSDPIGGPEGPIVDHWR
jgi:uncharacterized protein YjlB